MHTLPYKLLNKLIVGSAAAALALSGATAQAQSAPSDAQIAGIVVAANQVDIDAGRLAEKTSNNAEVKAFAKQMVTDHSGVNKQALALVKTLKLTPRESELGKSLKQGGSDNLARLRVLEGKAFDQAYVAHEVSYHQAVIDALDKTLIPNAKNAALKDTLVKVRPAFVAHLEHAKQLDAALR